jgi:hypothetical protein
VPIALLLDLLRRVIQFLSQLLLLLLLLPCLGIFFFFCLYISTVFSSLLYLQSRWAAVISLWSKSRPGWNDPPVECSFHACSDVARPVVSLGSTESYLVSFLVWLCHPTSRSLSKVKVVFTLSDTRRSFARMCFLSSQGACALDTSGWEMGPVANSCEHGKEPPGSMLGISWEIEHLLTFQEEYCFS